MKVANRPASISLKEKISIKNVARDVASAFELSAILKIGSCNKRMRLKLIRRLP